MIIHKANSLQESIRRLIYVLNMYSFLHIGTDWFLSQNI